MLYKIVSANDSIMFNMKDFQNKKGLAYELIVVKTEDTNAIVAFRRIHMLPNEKKKYRVSLGGSLVKYNISNNKMVIAAGRHNLVLNNEKTFTLNVTNGQLSIVEKTPVNKTTANKYKLNTKKANSDKKLIVFFNICIILNIISLIFSLNDDEAYP